MKLNIIGYLLKEGFRSIFQHGFMSFAAICVTVACLIIVGSFSALAYNLDIMVQDLNKTSEILVYIDSSLSDANDDYRAHRAGMAPPRVVVVPPGTFADWMKHRGRLGGQNKVPRIINDPALAADLVAFVGAP